jgi:Uncharacterized conserved protein
VNLLMIAHGTRDPAGARVTEAVAAQVRERLPAGEAALAYADVRGPTIAEALRELPGPAAAVPMFLAAGYHVRVDVPAQIRACGRSDVLVGQAFGPDPALVEVAAERLVAAGYRPGDAVVLAVAGSSDPAAVADSAQAARRLGLLLGRPVALATIAAGGPRVPEVVAALRAGGARRVAIASWLLAPGLFQQRLDACGADVVGAPIGTHSAVADLVVARHRAAGEPRVRPA